MNLPKKIEKENIEDIIGLTPLQKGMLFHYLKEPEGTQYFEQLSLRLKGSICIKTMKKAWGHVVAENEILRCLYRWDKLSEPMQIILKNYQLPINTIDMTNEPKTDQEELLKEIRQKDRQRGFDLTTEPMRITLIHLSKDEIEMIISNHHILYDGWSNGIIIKGFLEAYDTLIKNLNLKLLVKNKFKEYIKWSQSLDKERQREFWRSYLKDYEDKVGIPMIQQYKKNKEGVGKLILILEKELTENTNHFCRREKITLATLLSTAWGILLQRYNRTEDVVFGSTVSGRNPVIDGIESMVGLFINTIPSRVKLQESENVLQLLKRIEGEIRERETYETTSLLDIKDAGGIHQQDELFDTLLVIENYPLDQEGMNRGKVVTLKVTEVYGETNYNITMAITVGNQMELHLTYQEDLYSRREMQQVLHHFGNLLKEIILNPSRPVFELEIMTYGEQQEILEGFNATKKEYFSEKLLHEAFEEVAEATPEKVALILEEKMLSYKELNEKSNQLARILVEKGVGSNGIVALMVERSFEMIIGMLGILKADGAYLPIDPQYPVDRIQHMLKDSGTDILLTQTWLMESHKLSLSYTNFQGNIIEIDRDELYKGETSNLEVSNRGEDLAYIIYTSGSTGKPKGVMIQHKTIMNTLNWRIEYYRFTEADTILQIPTFAFDSSVEDIFTPLLSGGRLILLPQEKRFHTQYLFNCIDTHDVSHILLSPALYQTLLKEEDGTLSKLRCITLGGEYFNQQLVKEHFKKLPKVELYNEYGPTENSVSSTCYQLNGEDIKLLIGKPIHNVHCYIVDNYGRIQPIGVAGELWVSGAGVAKGYFNRSELTAEKFIDSPFVAGDRIYRTGDLARWHHDGNIEFLGRIDHQVKIRGYRIELGEIENQILTFQGIEEAVVIALEEENKDKYLCGYFCGIEKIDNGKLRSYLEKHLPDYMVPAYLIQMEQIPLNQHGKIDRKSLPTPDDGIKNNISYIPPSSRIEEDLIELWQEVLGKEGIGVRDHFFKLGGHSIKAIQLINKIHKVLEVEVTLRELFENATIEGLGRVIETKKKSSFKEIQPLPQQEYYELSFGQKRLWLLYQQNPNQVAYNMQGSITFHEGVDQKILSNVMQTLVTRHEGLRTYFELREGEPVQRIISNVELEIPLVDLTSIDDIVKKKKRDQEMEELAGTIFDLENAPLLKMMLVKLQEEKYELMFCMHHIISDGWSMEILKRELLYLYDVYKQEKIHHLPPLKVHYKDYAAWQNKELKSSHKIEGAKTYWGTKLRNELPKGYIPRDYSNIGDFDQRGEGYRWMLEKETLEVLNMVALKYQTSLFAVLLTAFAQLLSRFGQEKDVAIGIAGTAREHESLRNVVGFFVNTLVIRSEVDLSKPFNKQLRDIHQEVMLALEYQTYPLEMIVRELKVKYPAISIFFNMLNIGETLKENMIPFKAHHVEVVQSVKFDMVLYLAEYANGLEFQCDYLKGVYKKETIAYVMEKYKEFLKEVGNNPESTMKNISGNKPKRVIRR